MDSDILAYLSWREVLVAIVVLLVLYVLFTFLRISRLRNENRRGQEVRPSVAQSAVAAYEAVQAPTLADPGQEERAVPAVPVAEPAFPWNEPPVERPELRKIDALEQELAQLRREIGGLRADVHALREEKRREATKVQVAQDVSPYYSDAMQMAMQGHDAAEISVLCGISRAEAELVVALARNRTSRRIE